MRERATERGGARGFTLIEMMVTVGIFAILTTFAVAGWQRMKETGSLQGSALGLQQHLQLASARARERGANVWVVFFVDVNRNGEAGKGGGAYFVFEDRKFNFGDATVPSGEINYASFKPPSTLTGDNGVLLESAYLDDGRARFYGTGSEDFPAPFAGLKTTSAAHKSCTFCSNGGGYMRGAIVFTSEGTARFVDGSGATVAPAAFTNVGRAGALLMYPAVGTARRYQFAVAAPTTFIGTYALP